MMQCPTLHQIQIMYIRRTWRTNAALKAEDASTPHYTIINLMSGLFIILTPCSFPHKQFINHTPMLYTIIFSLYSCVSDFSTNNNSFITLNEQKLHWHSVCQCVYVHAPSGWLLAMVFSICEGLVCREEAHCRGSSLANMFLGLPLEQMDFLGNLDAFNHHPSL